jgi:anti-sigma regulatory factor (Ser/Thr protein kinase)
MQEKTFPGTLDSLAPVRAYVAEAGREAGLDSTKIYNLCLAVDEIATNIVVHGYEEVGLTGDLAIEAMQERGLLIIRLLDHGRSYAPEQIPDPDLANPLNHDGGGWGLFLSKTAVDEFDYTPSDSGNIHLFVMHLPGQIAANESGITKG